MSTIGPTLEAYFANRLVSQRQASPRTINAYRDLWRLLLHFACQRSGKTASKLDFGDLDAVVIAAFLTYLEEERGSVPPCRSVPKSSDLPGAESRDRPEYFRTLFRVYSRATH